MPDKSFGELFLPRDGDTVRFCTTQSISNDIDRHGITGVYQDGRYWSADMADHWSAHEVTFWQHHGFASARQSNKQIVVNLARQAGCQVPEGEPLPPALEKFAHLVANHVRSGGRLHA